MKTPTPDSEETVRVDSDSRPLRAASGAQFAPGTIIAGRYRIAGILGSGGMGEVYRAEDTKLDQHVALKFLPARIARDPVFLARLHDEVRLGRQIAHPNVCRIYDIIDWEGSHFVAMEYVDGEDLSRLLKRIGRIAHDKAVDIARGIAAGLMGAHAKGILHRDLKPANIMIDSRGDARIMDFGLALATGEDDGTISGTPAYMAPELFDGSPATVQSDLYALGLVMYELFTGKRAHNAHTLPERIRDLTSEITTPSSVIRDIDPAVERVILRCLNRDASQRPRSARVVIEALPGGDPLAAAMVAGETPSPRIVAAAGTEGTLKPAVAWSLLGAILLLITLILGYVRSGGYLRTTVAREPLEVQAARAGDLLRKLGIPRQEFEAYGLEENSRYSAWIFTHDSSPRRWERLRRGPPMVTFWMREEKEPMVDIRPGAYPLPVRDWPPQILPGAAAVETDSRGRMVSLAAIPSNEWKARPLRWSDLLAAAGLSEASLKPETPREMPRSFADARAAWSGKHPEDGTPIRVEAAAYRGVPVLFRITAPWDEVDARDQVPFGSGGFNATLAAIMTVALALGAVLAWRNLRKRRGDRVGAIRFGLIVFLASFLSSIFIADHELLVAHELRLLFIGTSQGLVWGFGLALGYLALEPYVRRRWPDKLISWARLLSGNWRDPMVGRDVLIGIAGGMVNVTLSVLSFPIAQLATGRPAAPFNKNVAQLSGVTIGFGDVTDAILSAILLGLVSMIVLMVLTIVLRRRSLAIAGLFALWLLAFSFASREWWMVPIFILTAALSTFLVARFGLLTMAAAHLTFLCVFLSPLPDAAAWYTARALTPVFFVLALAAWAFFSSLSGQRAFAAVKLDD